MKTITDTMHALTPFSQVVSKELVTSHRSLSTKSIGRYRNGQQHPIAPDLMQV